MVNNNKDFEFITEASIEYMLFSLEKRGDFWWFSEGFSSLIAEPTINMIEKNFQSRTYFKSPSDEEPDICLDYNLCLGSNSYNLSYGYGEWHRVLLIETNEKKCLNYDSKWKPLSELARYVLGFSWFKEDIIQVPSSFYDVVKHYKK